MASRKWYSHSNPALVTKEAAEFLFSSGLIDRVAASSMDSATILAQVRAKLDEPTLSDEVRGTIGAALTIPYSGPAWKIPKQIRELSVQD